MHCPSDKGGASIVASEWFGLEGYLTNPQYEANATSYAINIDGGYSSTTGSANFESDPQHIMYADLNIEYDGGPVACSSGVNNAKLINTPQPPALPSTLTVKWNKSVYGIHGVGKGNLVFLDGSHDYECPAGVSRLSAGNNG